MAKTIEQAVKEKLDTDGEFRIRDWSAIFRVPYDATTWTEVNRVVKSGYAEKQRRPNVDGVDEVWLVKSQGGV